VLPPSNLAHGPVRQLTARSSRTDTAEPAAHNLAMPAAPASSGTAIPFRILGPLAVSRDGTEVTIAGGRQRALLTYLLLHANRVVRTDRLIDELFGDEPPESALNSVHAGISRLRRQLRGSGGGEVPIVTRPPGYVLELEREQLDLHVFKDLLEAGRRELDAGKPEDARRTLADTLELWRGEPLADLSAYAFAREEAARLEDLHLAVVMERIEADLACGRHAEVIGDLEALVARHALQERLRAQLMLALYRSGRQADALRIYQETRRALVSELGLEPGKALQQLEQRILTHAPELDAPVLAPRTPERASPEVARRRTPLAVFVGAASLLAALAIAFLATRDDASGPSALAPNSVGVIDIGTNRLTAEVPVGESPGGISVGQDGKAWVVNKQDATLSLIDPERAVVLRTLPLPGRPSDVAVTRAVWVLHNRPGSTQDPYAGDASVTQVDPELLGVVATHAVPAGFGNDFEDPIAADARSVWVGGATGVSELDVETGKVSPRIPAGRVVDVAVVDGDLWAVVPDTGVVIVKAADEFVSDTITLGAATSPAAIAAGAEGVWVVSNRGFACCPDRETGTATVFRIDPGTHEVVSTIRVGGNASGIAVGAGSVWVADVERRAVLRIDPAKQAIAATIPLGGRPVAVAANDESAWVTVTSG
jgi:YVTN family beta-propeller protein